MSTITLKTIPMPAPSTRTILMRAAAPVVKGGGTITCRCGACKTVIISEAPARQMQDVVIRCPRCGAFNEVP